MKKPNLIKKRNSFGYFFISPYLIGLLFFIAIPLVEAIKISFSELTVSDSGYNLVSIGFENYKHIFAVDPNFRVYLVNSLKSMVMQVPVVILFSFFMASVLTTEFRGRGAVRTIVFLPVIITAGAVEKITNVDYMADTVTNTAVEGDAASNMFLSLLSGLNVPDGIIDFLLASVEGIYDIVVLSAVPIVIFIAALNSISESVFEAAHVEGATNWEIFWKIKFPISTPQILTSVVYCIIDSLNNASNPVVSAIKYATYEKWKYGHGAAMSFSYMLIIFVILIVVYRVIAKRVTYLD